MVRQLSLVILDKNCILLMMTPNKCPHESIPDCGLINLHLLSEFPLQPRKISVDLDGKFRCLDDFILLAMSVPI